MISEEKRQLGFAFSNRFEREIQTKTISVAGSPVQFSFSSTKTGYTPLMFTVYFGQSTTTLGGVETSTLSGNSFSASGYLKETDSSTRSVSITCKVLWVSTEDV